MSGSKAPGILHFLGSSDPIDLLEVCRPFSGVVLVEVVLDHHKREGSVVQLRRMRRYSRGSILESPLEEILGDFELHVSYRNYQKMIVMNVDCELTAVWVWMMFEETWSDFS